jgi:hypothetical protein
MVQQARDTGSSRSLLDKLGVKPGASISVFGGRDRGFPTELRAWGADVSVGRRRKGSDLVFLFASRRSELGKISSLEELLKRNGAIWVVFPKGRQEIREAEVIETGVAAGFVDNKVVRFSDTHTALRFVIPLARR